MMADATAAAVPMSPQSILIRTRSSDEKSERSVTWGENHTLSAESVDKQGGTGEGATRVTSGSVIDTVPAHIVKGSSPDLDQGDAIDRSSSGEINGEPQTPPSVPVDIVQSELESHFFGPTFETRAVIHRDVDEALGVVLLSADSKEYVQDPSHGVPKGTRVGSIAPKSPIAKCNNVHVGDRIVSINDINVRGKPHEEVVALLSQQTGTITIDLARSKSRAPAPVPEYVVQRGCTTVPSKLADKVRQMHANAAKNSGAANGSLSAELSPKGGLSRVRSSTRRKGGRKSGRATLVSVADAYTVTVHRHPNTHGLQIGVKGGIESDCFPEIVTTTQPRSPFFPLVEGGKLENGYELLEVDGRVVVGLSHAAIIDVLKRAGEEVHLRVMEPGRKRRQVSDLFASQNVHDEVTRAFCSKLRRDLYTRTCPVTTAPASQFCPPGVGTSRSTHVSLNAFLGQARSNEFLEWTLHDNGYFFAIKKDPTALPAGAPLAKMISEILEVQHDVSPLNTMPVNGSGSIVVSTPQKQPTAASAVTANGGIPKDTTPEDANKTPATTSAADATTNGASNGTSNGASNGTSDSNGVSNGVVNGAGDKSLEKATAAAVAPGACVNGASKDNGREASILKHVSSVSAALDDIDTRLDEIHLDVLALNNDDDRVSHGRQGGSTVVSRLVAMETRLRKLAARAGTLATSVTSPPPQTTVSNNGVVANGNSVTPTTTVKGPAPVSNGVPASPTSPASSPTSPASSPTSPASSPKSPSGTTIITTKRSVSGPASVGAVKRTTSKPINSTMGKRTISGSRQVSLL